MSKLFISFCTIFLFTSSALAYFPIPEHSGFVTDNAGVIGDQIELQLEQEFYSIQQNQNIEIALLTLPNLEGYPIELLANDVFNEWQLGDATQNSGLLYIIAPNDRLSRIELGYGIETILTDSQTLQIQELAYPYFQEQDFTQGSLVVIENLLQQIEGTSFTREEKQISFLQANWHFLFAMSFIYFLCFGMIKKKSAKTAIITGESIALPVAWFVFENIFAALPALYLNIWLAHWFYTQHKKGNINLENFSDNNSNGYGGFGGFGTGSSGGSGGFGGFGGFGGGSSGGGGSTGRW